MSSAFDPAVDPSRSIPPEVAPSVLALPLLKEALDAFRKNPFRSDRYAAVESLFRDLERDKERLEKQLQELEGSTEKALPAVANQQQVQEQAGPPRSLIAAAAFVVQEYDRQLPVFAKHAWLAILCLGEYRSAIDDMRRELSIHRVFHERQANGR